MVGIGALVAATAIQTNRANDVVTRSLDILGKATTVVGSFTQRMGKGVGQGDFHLKKGKKVAVYSDSLTDLQDEFFRTTINTKEGTYRVQDVRVYNLLYLPGFEAFTKQNDKTLFTKFNEDAKNNNGAPEPRDIRMNRINGAEVVSYVIAGSTVYLDPNTALPVGADFGGENGQAVQMRFQNVRLDVTLEDSMFSYTPDGTAKKEPSVEQGMLAVGSSISSSFINEAMSMLGKFMAGKKSSIIVFFDDKNAADTDALAKFDKLSRQVPKDVGIIAVARTKDWQRIVKGKLKFPLIVDAELPRDSIAARFGIAYYPSIYVVNDQKVVTYAQIGSATTDLDVVLKGLGIKNP